MIRLGRVEANRWSRGRRGVGGSSSDIMLGESEFWEYIRASGEEYLSQNWIKC